MSDKDKKFNNAVPVPGGGAVAGVGGLVKVDLGEKIDALQELIKGNRTSIRWAQAGIVATIILFLIDIALQYYKVI